MSISVFNWTPVDLVFGFSSFDTAHPVLCDPRQGSPVCLFCLVDLDSAEAAVYTLNVLSPERLGQRATETASQNLGPLE